MYVKILVIGNIGRDAVVNQHHDQQVINFNLAHSERYKDQQGVQHERTTWFRCSYWVHNTGIAPYLKKGSTIQVEGKPELHTYKDQNGIEKTELRIKVKEITLIHVKRDDAATITAGVAAGSASAPVTNASDVPGGNSMPVDDLPF